MVYAGHQRRNGERRQRRREADRARRQSAQVVVVRAAELAALAAARTRVEARHAELQRGPLASPTLWQFVAFQAKAGDRDAKRLWRAECEPLWAETRRERYATRAELVRQRAALGLVSDEHAVLKQFVTKVRRACGSGHRGKRR